MPIKGPFAPVRDGVLEHHREMTFPEIAVFHRLLNLANRRGTVGLCAGVGVRTLALGMGKDRGAIRRAIVGLEQKNYVKRDPAGLLVLNFTGESPQEHPTNGSSQHHGVENTMVSRAPVGGSSRHQGGGAKSTRRVVLRAPGIKRDGDEERDGDVKARSEPVEAPLPIPAGVRWSKVTNCVEMDDDFRSWLREHLESLATSEGLRMLTNAEFQDSWGRLNGHFIGNPRKRGAKTLRPITVNWLENDLRRNGRRISKRSSAMDVIREYEREASLG